MSTKQTKPALNSQDKVNDTKPVPTKDWKFEIGTYQTGNVKINIEDKQELEGINALLGIY